MAGPESSAHPTRTREEADISAKFEGMLISRYPSCINHFITISSQEARWKGLKKPQSLGRQLY